MRTETILLLLVGYTLAQTWDAGFSVCDPGTAVLGTVATKVFPSFPRRWHGSGVFQEIGNPSNRLIAEYFHDQEKGIGREFAKYIDKLQKIYFDFRPRVSNTTLYLPATEIWIELNRTTGIEECYIPPFPIPNLFGRDFWLTGTDLQYKGSCKIGGETSDCWVGHIAGAPTVPLLFCNLASRYPSFRPVVKQVFNFRFTEYWGEEQSEFPSDFIQPTAQQISNCKPLVT